MIKIHFNNGTDRQYADVIYIYNVIYLIIEGDRQIFFSPYINGLSKIAIDKSYMCMCVVSRGARNVFLIIYNLNS